VPGAAPALLLAAAAAVPSAAEGGATSAYPGPGPWGAREWAGAAIYGLLFLAALWGAWRLATGAPAAPEPPR
jgi:hypothetical protein